MIRFYIRIYISLDQFIIYWARSINFSFQDISIFQLFKFLKPWFLLLVKFFIPLFLPIELFILNTILYNLRFFTNCSKKCFELLLTLILIRLQYLNNLTFFSLRANLFCSLFQTLILGTPNISNTQLILFITLIVLDCANWLHFLVTYFFSIKIILLILDIFFLKYLIFITMRDDIWDRMMRAMYLSIYDCSCISTLHMFDKLFPVFILTKSFLISYDE